MTPMYLFGTDKNAVFQTHTRYRNYTLNEMHLSRKNDPATSAFIVVSSNTTLAMILEGMKNSIWWNHEARFLIVNENFDNGCEVANLFFSTVWAFNILSAIYLCYNSDRQLMLYAFNPYTSLAPKV